MSLFAIIHVSPAILAQSQITSCQIPKERSPRHSIFLNLCQKCGGEAHAE